MDFAPAYAKSVSIILPNTLIVIDKFHVIQEINRCLDSVRKDLQNYYRSQGVDIRRFKRARYLFMANWEDLTESGRKTLSQWFKEFHALHDAYLCKESFRDIYANAKTKKHAAFLFGSWINAIPDFERFEPMKKTMCKRRDHILNYWEAPYTNAYTESTNNSIKKIEKAGRGYKFETLRERCLLEINQPKPEKFKPREAVYVPVISAEPSEEANRKKIKELYAPDAKPITKSKEKPINTSSYSFKYSPQPAYEYVYQPYKGSLDQYLSVYLEMNDAEHRRLSFQKRMDLYYARLRELNL